MSRIAGPERPTCVQSVLPVTATRVRPVPLRSFTSVGMVRPESVVIQWPGGRTSGTSAGTIGSASVWPRPAASAKPEPSEPDFGSDLPPVQRIARRATKRPAAVSAANPAAVFDTASTLAGCTSVAPARTASRTSASRTVRAESLTGKSLPVSSRLSSTPASAKKRMVSSTPNRRKTLRIDAGVLPA